MKNVSPLLSSLVCAFALVIACVLYVLWAYSVYPLSSPIFFSNLGFSLAMGLVMASFLIFVAIDLFRPKRVGSVLAKVMSLVCLFVLSVGVFGFSYAKQLSQMESIIRSAQAGAPVQVIRPGYFPMVMAGMDSAVVDHPVADALLQRYR